MVRPESFCLESLRFALPRPLVTAHGEIRERIGSVVSLIDAEGRCGRGEAAPLPGFGLESDREAWGALERAGHALVASAGGELDALLDLVEAATEKAPSARGALDTALHELAARGEGCELAAFLAQAEGRAPRARKSWTGLLHEREPRALAEETRAVVAAGCDAVKLKIAAGDDDAARVAAVREACPARVELRLDANAGWSEAEAREALATLARFAPSYVEQPVASVEALARLRATSPVPLAVDESLSDPRAAAEIAARRAADVWVLKPAVVGGLRAARRIAAAGRAAGAEIVVGGFLDGPVGAAAARALAAALPGERPPGLGPA